MRLKSSLTEGLVSNQLVNYVCREEWEGGGEKWVVVESRRRLKLETCLVGDWAPPLIRSEECAVGGPWAVGAPWGGYGLM